MVIRRSMRAASSRLWVAIKAARPEARTRATRIAKTWPAVCGSACPWGSIRQQHARRLATARAEGDPQLLAAGELRRAKIDRRLEAQEAEEFPAPAAFRLPDPRPGSSAA
jgi:hypothetical protein